MCYVNFFDEAWISLNSTLINDASLLEEEEKNLLPFTFPNTFITSFLTIYLKYPQYLLLLMIHKNAYDFTHFIF